MEHFVEDINEEDFAEVEEREATMYYTGGCIAYC